MTKENGYFEAISNAMSKIGQNPTSIFIGQAVQFPGTAMHNTLMGVPKSQLLEVPVEEDFQMGMSIGFAMKGFLPVCIFPRWNFLLLATNQIVRADNIINTPFTSKFDDLNAIINDINTFKQI